VLRKRMPIPPVPHKVSIPAKKPLAFCIEQFITDFKDEQYLTLGMFVTVTVIMGFPLAFGRSSEVDGKQWDNKMEAFTRWIRDWIGATPLELKLDALRNPDLPPLPRNKVIYTDDGTMVPKKLEEDA
jgi:hypothetical protein